MVSEVIITAGTALIAAIFPSLPYQCVWTFNLLVQSHCGSSLHYLFIPCKPGFAPVVVWMMTVPMLGTQQKPYKS